MARLTKAIKGQILNSIIQAANKPQSKLLLAQEYALAEEIYWTAIGKYKATFKKLPAAFFSRTDAIQPHIPKKGFNKDIGYVTVQTCISNPFTGYEGIAVNYQKSNRNYHNMNYMYFKGNKQRPMPNIMQYGFELPTSLHKQFLAQNKINKKHIDSLQALQSKAVQLLGSVTTIDKLIKIWPDVKQYIPDEEMKKALPVVQVKDLIALIKCTKEACCSQTQITGKGTVIAL